MVKRRLKSSLLHALAVVCILVLFNEFFIYYFTIWTCSWPRLEASNSKALKNVTLRCLVLSDPHLLGKRNGHWFDKLRREWQMYRSYQTSLLLLQPDVVFILGDLTDEGKWASREEWDQYEQRSREIFDTPDHIQLRIVVGNHDVGFHHDITKEKLNRFFNAFHLENVQVLTIRQNLFILLNTMGLEDDGCAMCSDVQTKMLRISNSLKCSQKQDTPEVCDDSSYPPTKPILLQHFPLYRKSDESCTGADSVSKNEIKKFAENWDVVSETASKLVLDLFRPRLVLSGHTHKGCTYRHVDGTPEITVPSFSWRNRNNPSFLLVTVNPEEYQTKKCYLPLETTVFLTYGCSSVFLMIKLFVS